MKKTITTVHYDDFTINLLLNKNKIVDLIYNLKKLEGEYLSIHVVPDWEGYTENIEFSSYDEREETDEEYENRIQIKAVDNLFEKALKEEKEKKEYERLKKIYG